MAARDSNLFKLIFQPNGVIAQFKQSPEKRSVVLERRYFGKRPTLKLLRFLLPRYRVYREDNQLVEELYDHQEDDPNIRRLTLQSEPILSEAHHEELEKVDKEPVEQREEVQDRAVEKVISEGAKETGGSAATATAVLDKPPEPTPAVSEEQAAVAEAQRIVDESKELSEEKKSAVEEAGRIIEQAKQVETPGFAKSLVSGGSIQSRKLLTRINIATFISSTVGAVSGFGIAGPAGALAGIGAGMVITGTVAHGGGNGILQFGAGIADRVGQSISGLIKVPLFLLSPKKWLFLGLAVIVGIMVVGAGIQTGTSTAPTGTTIGIAPGATCPTQQTIDANKSSPQTCRYLNPSIGLFNTNLSKDSIDSYVIKYSTIFVSAGKGDVAEFRRRVNYIVNSSKVAGLNPSLFLGYWKTESNFSTVGSRDMGCLGDNFNEQVDCALGINLFADPAKNPVTNCAKSRDAESIACRTLKGIRANPRTDNRLPLDQANPIKYPIATFDDFAEAYGSRVPDLDGIGTDNNNCVSTYNKLLEVASELNACRAASLAQIGCPVKGATITNGSKETGGHCAPGYPLACSESDPTGRATAIDVVGIDNTVILPTINGANVIWTVTEPGTLIQDLEGGGAAVSVETDYNGKKYRLRMVHLDPSLLTPLGIQNSKQIPSNEPVGKYYLNNPYGAHVHITLQEDGKFMPADLYFNLCR